MTDKDGGMMTRGRRQRSQSREMTNGVPTSANGKSSSRVNNLETVAEIVHAPSTPQDASQKRSRTESSMSLGLNGSQGSGGVGGGGASRGASPLSFSRAQEKEELQNLNDRLAKILNKLNDSEEENKILRVQLKTVEEETSADLNDQISKYRDELGRARSAIDVITHEKDREILARDKAEAELRDTKLQLEKAKQRADESEARAKGAEKVSRDREMKISEMKVVFSEWEKRGSFLEEELKEVRRQLEDAKDVVEKEVLLRTGLENALKTAEEKAKFENNLLESKLQRQSLSVTTIDHSSRTGRRSGGDFSASVEEMRDALEEAREEIEISVERMYGQKIDALETLCDSQRESVRGLQQALDASRSDYKEVQKENQQLRSKVGKLEKELDVQYNKFDQHKHDCTSRMAELIDRANETSQLFQRLTEEYRDLKQDNIEMTTELGMYNKLLEEEEIRLGIQSPNGSTYGRGRKRRHVETLGYNTPGGLKNTLGGSRNTPGGSKNTIRTTVKKSENKSRASGVVRILEVVPGKVVRVENTGDAIVQLGNWVIQQKGVSGEAIFKFKKDQAISGRSIISIYSATEMNVPHDGITEILAGNPWMVDGHLETVLSDGEGKEMAVHQIVADSNSNSEMELELEGQPIREESPRRGGFIGRIFGM